MFQTLRAIGKGFSIKAEKDVKNHFASELIEEKITEAEQSVTNAKNTLASLILRERQERKARDVLVNQMASLEKRTIKALEQGHDALAEDAAQTLATMTHEREIRDQTLKTLSERIARMHLSVEKAHRRLADLKMGQITANAMIEERRAQGQLMKSGIGRSQNSAFAEAEKLIASVCAQEDVFEKEQVLEDIDAHLTPEGVERRLAEKGLNDPSKITAAEILADLKARKNAS